MEDPKEKLDCKVQEAFLDLLEVQEREVPGVSWGKLVHLVPRENQGHQEGEECQDLMAPWDKRENLEEGGKWDLLDQKGNLVVLVDLVLLDYKD